MFHILPPRTPSDLSPQSSHRKMANNTFSREFAVDCHGDVKINVLYTNMAASVDEWIVKVESIFAAAPEKVFFVGSELHFLFLQELNFNFSLYFFYPM